MTPDKEVWKVPEFLAKEFACLGKGFLVIANENNLVIMCRTNCRMVSVFTFPFYCYSHHPQVRPWPRLRVLGSMLLMSIALLESGLSQKSMVAEDRKEGSDTRST